MTQTAVRADDREAARSRQPTPAPHPAQGEHDGDGHGERARRAEFPRHRSITAHVTDGMDGVLRVAMMLRGRGYRVRDLSVDVREGVVESEFTCIIALNASETGRLLEQLRRVPVVVSAHCR